MQPHVCDRTSPQLFSGKEPFHYEPPGWEVQEVAKDTDRLIGEGGKD